MTELIISIIDADQETQRRAIEALHAAGIKVHQSWFANPPDKR